MDNTLASQSEQLSSCSLSDLGFDSSHLRASDTLCIGHSKVCVAYVSDLSSQLDYEATPTLLSQMLSHGFFGRSTLCLCC